MEKYDAKSLVEIFIKINDIMNKLSGEYYFSINIQITTVDGVVTIIELSSNEEKKINISKNIIVYDNIAISLTDIVKITIVTNKLIKDRLMIELKNIDRLNTRYLYNTNYQRRVNKRLRDIDIEEYIYENMHHVDSIRLNSIIDSNSIIGKDKNEEIKECNKSSLDVKKEKVLQNIDIITQNSEVINYIDLCPQDVITHIDIEKKEILTKNANEIEVAKPIQTKPIKVATDINIKDCNVIKSQSKTTAVKNIKQNKYDVVTDIYPTYIHGVIGNINYNEQIIKPKTVDILCIEPINGYVDKNEIKSKPLRLDPTGEMYIGVVLDDGTFEPLQISKKTITTLDDNVENLLGNIESKNQINKVIEEINESKESLIKTLDIEYSDNIAEYGKENMINLKDIINVTSDVINNVENLGDTAYLVTKDYTEEIKNIKNIEKKSIQQVNKVKNGLAIKKVKIENNFINTIADVKLNQMNGNISKKSKIINKKENINGNIEYVGEGIMIVDNGGLDITIYSTSKINSVNL